jgi:hypothetical protein
VQRKADKRRTDDTIDSKKDECISDYQYYAQTLSGNFGHYQHIGIFWTYNEKLRFSEKSVDVRTDRWQWQIRKTVYKMIS